MSTTFENIREESQKKLDELKAQERTLDKLFDQTKYASKIESLAAELADAFIANLNRNGIDNAVGKLCETIREEPLRAGERSGR